MRHYAMHRPSRRRHALRNPDTLGMVMEVGVPVIMIGALGFGAIALISRFGKPTPPTDEQQCIGAGGTWVSGYCHKSDPGPDNPQPIPPSTGDNPNWVTCDANGQWYFWHAANGYYVCGQGCDSGPAGGQPNVSTMQGPFPTCRDALIFVSSVQGILS